MTSRTTHRFPNPHDPPDIDEHNQHAHPLRYGTYRCGDLLEIVRFFLRSQEPHFAAG